MKRLLLVRHALTPYDIAGPRGRFCGSSNPSLSDAGILEAQELGRILRGVPIKRIFSSPLARGFETAETIVGNRQISIVKDSLLSEIDYGPWEGLTKQEVTTRFAFEYKQFTIDPVLHYPAEGESPRNCLSRARDWLNRLEDEYTIAVTHKTWTRLLICDLLNISISEYRRALDLKIAGITVLVCGDRWRLDALNFAATGKRILGL